MAKKKPVKNAELLKLLDQLIEDDLPTKTILDSMSDHGFDINAQRVYNRKAALHNKHHKRSRRPRAATMPPPSVPASPEASAEDSQEMTILRLSLENDLLRTENTKLKAALAAML